MIPGPDHVFAYAALGLHMIPIEPRDKAPAIADWASRATTDPRQVARWFERGERNLGIVCGPSGIVVVDVDPRNGGRETFAALERELCELPPTWTADSGGGGDHRVFRRPVGELVAKLGDGVDLLHGGRQFLVEPSVHPSGGRYTWRAGLAPWDVEIAELPVAWLDRARRKVCAPRSRPATSTPDFFDALAQLDQGEVLLAISGTRLVRGQVITLGRSDRRGCRAIVIDGKTTSGFVDGEGRIVHRVTRTDRPDGGPLASTWCRYYRHDDSTIRRMLIELVPELRRFTASGVRRTGRAEPTSADLRGRTIASAPSEIVPYAATDEGVAEYEALDWEDR